MRSICDRKKRKDETCTRWSCVDDRFMIISRKDGYLFWYPRLFRNTWGQAAVSLCMWLQHLFSASTADGDHYHISLQVFAGSRTAAARGGRCWQLFPSHKHTPGVHISLHIKSPQQQGIFACYMLRLGHLSAVFPPLVLPFIVILTAFISEPSKGCNRGHWWISINNLRGTVLLFLQKKPHKKKYLLWYKARTKRLGGIKTKKKAWAKTECGFEILCRLLHTTNFPFHLNPLSLCFSLPPSFSPSPRWHPVLSHASLCAACSRQC